MESVYLKLSVFKQYYGQMLLTAPDFLLFHNLKIMLAGMLSCKLRQPCDDCQYSPFFKYVLALVEQLAVYPVQIDALRRWQARHNPVHAFFLEFDVNPFQLNPAETYQLVHSCNFGIFFGVVNILKEMVKAVNFQFLF